MAISEEQIRRSWRKLLVMLASMAVGLVVSTAAMYYWQGIAAAWWYVGFVALYWGYKTEV